MTLNYIYSFPKLIFLRMFKDLWSPAQQLNTDTISTHFSAPINKCVKIEISNLDYSVHSIKVL